MSCLRTYKLSCNMSCCHSRDHPRQQAAPYQISRPGTIRKYALVAGYTEIGESLEDTVRREVMEEVGLTVTNIRFYKSQPWSFSGSLLAGFFCDLSGDDETVRLQEDELSEASWFDREELPDGGSSISLTHEMIEAFRNGKC